MTIDAITHVRRVKLKRGYRFFDQAGNVLRKQATRPYTHMAVNQWPNGEPFLSFHSTPNPTKTHRTLTILRIIPIREFSDADWLRYSQVGCKGGTFG